jgi:putative membrane protein
MISRIVFGLSVAMMTFGAAAAAPAVNKSDQKFVTDAIEGDLAEVQIGKLVQQKGTDDQTRSFGEMLVTDHSANNEKASALANSLGITAPTEPNKMQKAMYDRLSKLSGKAFDRQAARMMVAGHRKTIKEFDKEAKSSNDQVAGFAKDTLPTLQKHLEAAQSLVKTETAEK